MMPRLFIFLIGHVLLSSSLSFVPSQNQHSRRLQLESTASEEPPQLVKKPKIAKTVSGPPEQTKPDYEKIHGPLGRLMDKVFMSVFRIQMAKRLGIDSKLPKDDYQGLMELTAAMNARYSDRREVQGIAQDVLREFERHGREP